MPARSTARAARRVSTPRTRPEAARIETPSGASAEARGDVLVLRDRRGAVVVVFDAEKGTAEISAPSGDLVLAAPSGKIALRAPEVVCEAGKIELRAERLIERVRDVYLEVEGVVHTRAERVRTIARDVFQVFSKRASVVAEEDASIDGKRVLLG